MFRVRTLGLFACVAIVSGIATPEASAQMRWRNNNNCCQPAFRHCSAPCHTNYGCASSCGQISNCSTGCNTGYIRGCNTGCSTANCGQVSTCGTGCNTGYVSGCNTGCSTGNCGHVSTCATGNCGFASNCSSGTCGHGNSCCNTRHVGIRHCNTGCGVACNTGCGTSCNTGCHTGYGSACNTGCGHMISQCGAIMPMTTTAPPAAAPAPLAMPRGEATPVK